MSLLLVENVSKSFGGINALSGVSLRVEQGEILGLVGPNGAGKTTLVNIVSGFLKPDSGRIYFEGRDISDLSPVERARLGIMRSFQGGRVFWHLPVVWNVFASASVKHKGWNAVARTAFAMTVTGISHLADKPPSELSIYHVRLVELARILAGDPILILLDEPFAGLSPGESDRLLQIIWYANRALGASFIIIDHKVDQVLKAARRITVLSEGHVIFDGDPEEAFKDERVVEAYLGRGVRLATT